MSAAAGWVGILSAGWLTSRALSCLIQPKKKWWCRLVFFVLCAVLISTIIYIGDLVNLSLAMAVFLTGIWVVCEGSGWKKLSVGVMFASVVSAFAGLFDNCIADVIYYGFGVAYIPHLVGRVSFALLLYLVMRTHRLEQDFELSEALWRLILLLAVPPLGIVVSLVLLKPPYYQTGHTFIADGVVFLMVIFLFTGLLLALSVLEKQQRLEQESALAEHNRKYYEAMEQQQFEIRRLRHDLSNHLQVILSLSGDERERYIQGLLDHEAFTQVTSYCGDGAVNVVVTAKESLMRQRHIRFYVKMDIPQELPFEKADICGMLANALDNAAEGCQNLPEELREVQLEARAGKGIFAVSVKNPCMHKLDIEDGKLPKTTKKDKENHGLGLKSIQKTVQKYGGQMEIEQEGQQFRLFFYLPV